MSAVTEDYVQKPTLQYMLNWFLSDEHQEYFLEYMKKNKYFDFEEDFASLDEKTLVYYIEEYKEYSREVCTDYEDLYMTNGI
jgi:hypothetical protein